MVHVAQRASMQRHSTQSLTGSANTLWPRSSSPICSIVSESNRWAGSIALLAAAKFAWMCSRLSAFGIG